MSSKWAKLALSLMPFVLCWLAASVNTAYVLTWEAKGTTFFDKFNFMTHDDYSHGYVNYVNQSYAQAKGLISVNTNGQVRLATDTTKNVTATARGRDSVRLESKVNFNGGLFIADIAHMPTGCGTWPAWWLYGPSWPTYGEIDIIEGVHQQTRDVSTLHTNAGCNMSSVWKPDPSKVMTGNYTDVNCDTYQGDGCGVYGPQNSFGAPFNSRGGGYYILEWTAAHLKMWHFNRTSVPSDIKAGNPNDPSNWGKPYAYFGLGANCPSSHFRNHTMTINLDFCGDWAGTVWQYTSVCKALASTCANYVQYNPAAFTEAYWLFNSVRVYQLSK